MTNPIRPVLLNGSSDLPAANRRGAISPTRIGFKSTALILSGLLLQASQGRAFANSAGIFQADSNGLSHSNSGPPSSAGTGGASSIAIGINAQVVQPTGSGDGISIGTDTSALNQDAIAIGAQTTASGYNTIAIGNNVTTASGDNSVVFGVTSTGSGAGSSVFGNLANVSSDNGSAFGIYSYVTAIGGSAFGANSSATSAYGTALGYGSIANRAGLRGSEAFSNTAMSSPYGALSIGAPGSERQIQNVAGGTQDTDAVNVRQLRAVGANTANALGGGASYGTASDNYAYTPPTYTIGGQTYHDVASAMSASNRLAVQYTPDALGNSTAAIDLTKSGTIAPTTITGLAPATTASGAVSLSQLPLQYSTRGAPTTANPATPSDDVTLIGSSGQPVTLHNVAAGALSASSTDAVNGQQLYTTNQTVASLRSALDSGSVGLVQQDTTTRGITVGSGTDGTDVNFGNVSGAGRTLSNVAGGQIASGSRQAVNGGQAYNMGTSVVNALGGGAALASDGSISAPSYSVQGTTYNSVGGAIGGLDAAVAAIDSHGSKFFAVNTTGSAASATGADSVAIGPSAATTADRGVALGAGSVASRAGMNGARELFSGAAVTSNAGAVSVGDVGAERQITNVAGGTAATDAVNVRQLTAVAQTAAATFGGGAAINPDGSLQAPSYSIAGRSYSNVGDAFAAVDQTGVKYDVDPGTGGRGNSVTLQGGDPDQPVLIRNVASGRAAGDAANTGQVNAAKAAAYAYTDQSIAGVEQQIGSVGTQLAGLQTQVDQAKTEARRGAAIGLAAGSLRYDDRPGKISTAVGGGVWKGQVATALGLGYALPGGWGRINASGVTSGRDFGFGAGANFTLN